MVLPNEGSARDRSAVIKFVSLPMGQSGCRVLRPIAPGVSTAGRVVSANMTDDVQPRFL